LIIKPASFEGLFPISIFCFIFFFFNFNKVIQDQEILSNTEIGSTQKTSFSNLLTAVFARLINNLSKARLLTFQGGKNFHLIKDSLAFNFCVNSQE